MIYEEKTDQKTIWQSVREEVNTPEQIKRAEYYLNEYYARKAEVEEEREEWEEIDKQYRCHRESTGANDPNSFIPVTNPCIEGQIAAMTEKFISASVKGRGYSDHRFARTGQIMTDFTYDQINIRQKVKDGERRYLLFGNGIFAFGWDPDALDGYGLPEWRSPRITKVFFDGRIKDIYDYQKSEYAIEEMGSCSIEELRREKGDKIADAVMVGNTIPEFAETHTYDDEKSYTKLVVWTRNNDYHNLQKIEMSLCGIIIEESDPSKPYYLNVENQYPYAVFGLYPKEGRFYRFGDGKLLMKLQDKINKLYDEVEIACRYASQQRTFVDPTADCDPDQFDNDPSHPIVARNPNQTIKTDIGQGINAVVFSLISSLMHEVEKAIRFSALMTGNAPQREITATQVGVQLQQGNTGIDDKRNDISTAIAFGTKYCLGLELEHWPAALALRIADTDEFEWVDVKQLNSIPVMVPVDNNYIRAWKEMNPGEKVPKWMQLAVEKKDPSGKAVTDKDGNPITEPQTKTVAFDLQVSIGEGIPTNKLALFNIILSLARLVVPDEQTGLPRSVLSYQQVTRMIEDVIGLPMMKIFNANEMNSITAITNAANSGALGKNQNVPNTGGNPATGNPYIDNSMSTQTMSNQPMNAGGM
ncbi:MAG: hypothetical protein ACM3TR_09870 [Caulobacteraceae bacterium]